MNILVVNDDGIHAKGIQSLIKALSEVVDVYVVSPDGQRSASGQSISIRGEVSVTPVDIKGTKGGFKISGTPTDCTKIGLQFFKNQGIEMDMVFSGINMGSNLGIDTLYSGTVGAAMEGAISGLRSIALSVDNHEASDFDVACDIAVGIIPFAMEKIPAGTVLNINIPDVPKEEIKGIRYTRLAGRYYKDGFVEAKNGMYKMEGEPSYMDDYDDSFDISAIAQKYCSLTALKVDRTDEHITKRIENDDPLSHIIGV